MLSPSVWLRSAVHIFLLLLREYFRLCFCWLNWLTSESPQINALPQVELARATEPELTPASALRAKVPLGASLRAIESKLTPASALRSQVLCPA